MMATDIPDSSPKARIGGLISEENDVYLRPNALA